MQELYIYENATGKLFCDNFSHLCLPDEGYFPGAEFKLMYRSIDMGIVRIEAMRDFPFFRLSDVVSFLNIGQAAQYQAAKLNRFYKKNNSFDAGEMITHLVCGYVSRSSGYFDLLKEWSASIEAETLTFK